VTTTERTSPLDKGIKHHGTSKEEPEEDSKDLAQDWRGSEAVEDETQQDLAPRKDLTHGAAEKKDS
jgi:hypothetical protein